MVTIINSQNTTTGFPGVCAAYFLFFVFISLFACVPASFSLDVSLSWDSNEDADYYIVYWGKESQTYTENSEIIDKETTRYTVTNLDTAKYFFAVKAFNECGNSSDFSDEISNELPDFNASISLSGGSVLRVNDNLSLASNIKGGTAPITYNWDFGTQDISPSQNAVPTDIRYSTPGTYTITLSATDAKGLISTDTTDIVISPEDTTPTVQIVHPSESSVTAVPNASLRFAATVVNGNNPLSYHWTLDGQTLDGESEVLNNVLFPFTGEYLIQLTVTDKDGDIGQASITVTVSEPDEADKLPEIPVISFRNLSTPEPLSPIISASPFQSENPDAYLRESHWEIYKKTGDTEELVFSRITTGNVESITVPELILDELTTYSMRVQHVDNIYQQSGFSAMVDFTTKAFDFEDSTPQNGIPDYQEPIENTDLDRNDIPDSSQNNMKRVETDKGQIIGVKPVDENVTVDRLLAFDTFNSVNTENMPSNMPLGYIGFKLSVPAPGDIVEIKIYFEETVPYDGKWYKYDTITGWLDYSAHSQIENRSNEITLTLKDGGFGDSDGVENGIITDPGGLSFTFLKKSGYTGMEADAATCFIKTAIFFPFQKD